MSCDGVSAFFSSWAKITRLDELRKGPRIYGIWAAVVSSKSDRRTGGVVIGRFGKEKKRQGSK